MEFLESIRYFFNVYFPESILNTISLLSNIMNDTLGWILFILLLCFIYISYKLYEHQEHLKHHEFELDEILFLSTQHETIDALNKSFLELMSWLNGSYYSLYKLHGETYVLLSSNIDLDDENFPVSASLHLRASEYKKSYTSGNFTVNTYQSNTKEYIVSFYGKKTIILDRYRGTFESLLSQYDAMSREDKQSTNLQLARTSKELLEIINGSRFGNYGYMRYLLSMVKKVLNAKQVSLHSKDKVHIKLGECIDCNEKIFYIRNTKYKVVISIDETLSASALATVGSFLDLTGVFISTLDEESTIAKNYIVFLEEANTLLENGTDSYLHSKKVYLTAIEIGKTLFLSLQELDALGHAAMLHDIGSIADLDDLTNEYYDATESHKLHPLIGAILIEPIGNIYPISNIIKYHHERIDGKGYPFGLEGAEIPFLAQILGLAEYYIGLISKRSSSLGMEYEGAIYLIENSADKMFDKVIIEAFIKSHEKIHKKIIQLEAKNSSSKA